MKTRNLMTVLCLVMAGATSAQAVPYMTLVGGTPLSGAYEISAYDKFTNRIFSTVGGNRLEIFDFGNGRNVTDIGDVNLGSVGSFNSFSSVSVDPLGRGFGVATGIPAANTTTLGKAIFFNTTTGAILGSVDVGFHPDMVTFSPDGAKILVANEGEAGLLGTPSSGTDAAGSISIINLAGVAGVGDVAGLSNASVTTLGLGGLSLTGLRINPSNAATPHNDLEPEYIAVSPDGTKAFISVQEANAVITLDLTNNAMTIKPLGAIVQRIDASNTDGVDITSNITSLFMPDAIAAYTVGGKTYYVTANEGDTRDSAEFPFVTSDAVRIASANIDPTVKATLDVTNNGVGRLNISRFDGDTDNDGDIDVPTAFGTRSFTIWDAQTGARVFDSGSAFEVITAQLVNAIYNSSDSSGGGDRDSRSDDKGPEPEAVTIGLIEGRYYAFIGLERVGGFFTYDITDPNNPFFVQYNNPALERGLGATTRPEGLIFISAADSPTGEAFVILSHEGQGGLQIYATVIPEPVTVGLLSLSLPVLLGRRRRCIAS